MIHVGQTYTTPAMHLELDTWETVRMLQHLHVAHTYHADNVS